MKESESGVFNFFLLFVGLLLGVFLGGGVVYWFFDRQNDMVVQNKLNQIATFFSENAYSPDQEKETTIVIAAPAQSADKNERSSSASSKLNKNPENRASHGLEEIESTDSVIFNDSSHTHLLPNIEAGQESPELPESNINQLSETVNILIEQDQLLATRKIVFPIEYDVHSLSESLRDTLLGNPATGPIEQVLLIEFWESPLNSFGYRMGKNKIAIYGIRLFDFVSFIRYQGQIYLKYLNDYYPLEISTIFRPLIPVSDPYLIDQLQ